MPELPEVETITRQLNEVLVGRKIVKIETFHQKSFLGNKIDLIGKKIEKVSRKSKMLVISFVGYDKLLVVHLKMTGQLIYIEKTQKIENSKNQKLKESQRIVGGHPTADWVSNLPSKHTRVIIDFGNGGKLFFNDLRVFGWMKVIDNGQWKVDSGRMAPDVIDGEFTLEYFRTVLRKSGRSIKLVLLDQAKMGGVGNIYANDALYKVRVDPRRKANELSDQEVKGLHMAVKKVINLGIKYGGASVDKYVDAAGVGGKYQEHFLVYKKEGEKCNRDGNIIRKIKIGGRGTYYCSGCQK